MKTRHINQDPLENFFGCLRASGCRNVNPTCTAVCAAYKVLLINNLSSRNSIGRNCENMCDGQLLFTLEQFISRASAREDVNFTEIEEEGNERLDNEVDNEENVIDTFSTFSVKKKYY